MKHGPTTDGRADAAYTTPIHGRPGGKKGLTRVLGGTNYYSQKGRRRTQGGTPRLPSGKGKGKTGESMEISTKTGNQERGRGRGGRPGDETHKTKIEKK